jgi:hypothetical protein
MDQTTPIDATAEDGASPDTAPEHDGPAPPPSTGHVTSDDAVEPHVAVPAAAKDPLDLALGVVRLGVGAALVAAPRWAGRIWVGPGADGPGSLVFARALGARDVLLGLRILEAVRAGEPATRWIQAGFAADAADLTATLIAGRHLEGSRRIAMPLVAGAVAAAGVWSARRGGFAASG